MLADGLMELVVTQSTDAEIQTEVVTGGVLSSYKGINLPTGSIRAPALTAKDRKDLACGLAAGVDYVALSFVRCRQDVVQVKASIQAAGYQTPVVAKIEKHEAVADPDGIIDAADAIMVARGDLGVEVPLEEVPSIQKMLIRKANAVGKPVIIATQMLRSMVDAPRPTRAEAADVANAVLDGADAVMLSEETASGRYPAAAACYMARIIHSAEKHYPHHKYMGTISRLGVAASVAYAACVLAEQLDAAAIVATTRSGLTARLIARFRPAATLIALSPDEATVRQLALHWGCRPFLLSISEDTDEMIERAAEAALESGRAAAGELAVITGGRPLWAEGTTNMLWVKTL
jgi:pyruvate kinase